MSNEITIEPAPTNALTLITDALKSGASPEMMRELLAVKKDWEADEARKAFAAAVADFQARVPIIPKEDVAYDKKYARMDRIWRMIRPLMKECGLAITFAVSELRADGLCHMEGHLRHRAGHSERIVFDVPLPERIKTKSGNDAQNAAQQMGSATSYARRFGTCLALGIQTGDDDDDGHAAGTTFVTYAQATELEDLIAAARGVAGFNEPAFWAWAEAKSVGEIPAAKFAMAKASLQKKIKGGAA